MNKPSAPSDKTKGPVRRFFALLGPGLVTGAADDDPSGIVTYSIAGAQLGTSMLWTALLTFPLMATVQMMCARIGMVTGMGLAAALRKKMPKPVLALMGLALFTANTVNVGADLSGMADVANLLTGLPAGAFVVFFGTLIIVATIWFKYNAIASILKWLALSLFAYVITAFLVHPDWPKVLADTFLPTWPRSHAQWSTLVAILGTTISPYLFFWQSSQEVEVEKARGQHTVASRRGGDPNELKERAIDVSVGAFFSNLIMYFIILTTALTLHKNGITQLDSSKDAVQALSPLAGHFAALLYAVGLIGVGLLAIPTLAGSAAYAFSETFGFRQGLDQKTLPSACFLRNPHPLHHPRSRPDLHPHQAHGCAVLERSDQWTAGSLRLGGDSSRRLGQHVDEGSAELAFSPPDGLRGHGGDVYRRSRHLFPVRGLGSTHRNFVTSCDHF